MNHTYTFTADPGHGWLAVHQKDCEALSLTTRDFSQYSYWSKRQSGVVLYLEEDCDAPIFINAYEARHGKRPTIRVKYVERTRIRNMYNISQ